jgi:glyoxylase-like metal-dependent hydrolase (beta-lactamase superfamily II)
MVDNLAQGVQAFTSNVFLVDGDQRALVDTGANFDVVSRIENRVADLDVIVLTHTHPDHVGNLDAVTAATSAEVYAQNPDFEGVDQKLGDGDMLRLGDHEYAALYTPGHKNDHICLYSDDAKTLFAGDLIFANGGFGRTDLAEGSRQALIRSIQDVLDTVDEDLAELHTGHGPSVDQNAHQHVELALQAAKMG